MCNAAAFILFGNAGSHAAWQCGFWGPRPFTGEGEPLFNVGIQCHVKIGTFLGLFFSAKWAHHMAHFYIQLASAAIQVLCQANQPNLADLYP